MNNILPLFLVLMTLLRLWETFHLDKNREQGKIYAHWTLFVFSFSYVLTVISTITEFFLVGKVINLTLSGIGFCMLFFRFFIKIWAVHTLDKYWSSNIEIRDTQKLVEEGPYRYLRHPAYSARLIEIVGIPLILNSYVTLLVGTPLHLLIIWFRIRVEEKVLVEKFGVAYEKYQKEVWSLLPGVK